MSLWENIAADIAAATGRQTAIKPQGEIGGGCINQAQRVRAGETDYFVKLNSASRVDMFMAEFEGLNELRQCADLHIPVPLCCGHRWPVGLAGHGIPVTGWSRRPGGAG